MMISNLKYNLLVRQLKTAKAHSKCMKDVLECIAGSKRGGSNKRLAESCLGFLKHITPSSEYKSLWSDMEDTTP